MRFDSQILKGEDRVTELLLYVSFLIHINSTNVLPDSFHKRRYVSRVHMQVSTLPKFDISNGYLLWVIPSLRFLFRTVFCISLVMFWANGTDSSSAGGGGVVTYIYRGWQNTRASHPVLMYFAEGFCLIHWSPLKTFLIKNRAQMIRSRCEF